MSTYNQTANYIWCKDDKLGMGATANVYKGMNKNNGEPVAIKAFYRNCDPREIRILERVNHKNIVKLLGIEDLGGSDNVLVMELCTGGSLNKVLSKPENAYGLNDAEFLSILSDLNDGIKYLRDENLIHRDIKPDNIMKCIYDDGSCVYKLTDFGAARELQEGEQYQSIYGTEEYLHPDMYERAFLTRKPTNFEGTVDLWSLGATLYHVATGTVPFRPYGGRLNRDKRAMYNITSKKETGVISGIQTAPNGRIIYSKKLPDNCLLSDSLKELITPLLAGLMETDLDKSWQFNQFFVEVDKILSKKVVHVFTANQMKLYTFYLSPDDKFETLRRMIDENTGSNTSEQIFLFKDQVLAVSKVSDIPFTTKSIPIVLFDMGNTNISPNKECDMSFPHFSTSVHVDNDAVLCEQLCKIGYIAKRIVEKYLLHSKLVYKGVEGLTKHLNYRLEKLLKDAQNVDSKIRSLQMSSSIVTEEFQNQIETFRTDTLEKISTLYKNTNLDRHWKQLNENFRYFEIASAQAKTTAYIKDLNESYEKLVKDRSSRILSFNEERMHTLEKNKVNHIMLKMQRVCNQESHGLYKTIAHKLGDWFAHAQITYKQIEFLYNEVKQFDQVVEEFQTQMKASEGKTCRKRNSFDIFCQNISGMLPRNNDNDVIKLINENCDLMNKLKKQVDEFQSYLMNTNVLSVKI